MGHEVHVPCKARNLHNLEQIFAYLDAVFFHPISDDVANESNEVNELARELGLDIVNAGRSVLNLVQKLQPKEGLNVALMISAGYKTSGLGSVRFRDNILKLPQIVPPLNKFIFLNKKSSLGVSKIPEIQYVDNEMLVLEEKPEKPIYEHAALIDQATELHSIGSAFMCLALVMESRAPVKIILSDIELLTDDPEKTWKKIKCDSNRLTPLNSKTE